MPAAAGSSLPAAEATAMMVTTAQGRANRFACASALQPSDREKGNPRREDPADIDPP
jgi:hypothetical protein